MITEVRISPWALKKLERMPRIVVRKLYKWIESVQTEGLFETRKIPGLHDEPLKGTRKGQRSIRLNKAYRAVYSIDHDGIVEFVFIKEVLKHEY